LPAMAGLIGLTSSDVELQDALGARWEYDGEWIPHPIVRLTTTLPVAVHDGDGRKIVRARWGFPVGPRPIGNARDDKVAVSPLWSRMLGKSHALVAATGVYEMIKNNAGEKQSYWFRRVDGKPIIMPALVGERVMHGEARLCAAIVTTQPNEFFGRYHARQVCTLNVQEQAAWLAADNADEAMHCLHAPGVNDWEAVPVDAGIFQPGRREMEDLVPTGEPEHF